MGKTISNIKNNLTPRQLYVFRQTCFGHCLDLNLVFNEPLCHYILLREVKETKEDTISFKLLGRKVSLGREQFDLVTGLRYNSRHVVEANLHKPRRQL